MGGKGRGKLSLLPPLLQKKGRHGYTTECRAGDTYKKNPTCTVSRIVHLIAYSITRCIDIPSTHKIVFVFRLIDQYYVSVMWRRKFEI